MLQPALPSAETLKALETVPNMYLILSPDLYILTASNIYLAAIETSREKIVGKHIFEAFPDNPDLPDADGMQNINASLQEVLRTKKPHYMQIQRYDVPNVNNLGQFIQRYWDPSHTPVLDEAGEIQYIIQLANDVTEKVLTKEALAASSGQLHWLNDQLDDANRKVVSANQELNRAVDTLKFSNQNLEALVNDRTAELAATVEELAASNEELAATNEELLAIQEDLYNLNTNLYESEQRFRSLIEYAPLPILVCKGEDMVFEMVNEAMLQMLGKSTAVIGQPLIAALPELRGQPIVDVLYQVYHTGEPYSTTAAQVTLKRNGKDEICYFNLNYRALYEGSKVVGIIQAAVEVTGQVKAHQTIVESEERFRTMAESTHVLIAVSDEASNSTYFNKAWTDLTGRPTSELLKHGWFDLVHPEDKEHYLNTYLTAFKEKLPFTAEFRILGPQGAYRWLLAKGSPRFHPNGTFAGYTSSSIDVTEQKLDEQRKNDFIGIVSHELKTPVTTIYAYLQVLQGKARKTQDPFILTALDKSVTQVKKMTTIINGFLNVSRLESGKIYIDKQRFDMANLVKETEAETATMISSHQIIFAPVEPTFVVADRDKIGQVINNFISNAVKYSAPGSTINIACISFDGQTQVSVKDEGIGIDETDIQQLFNRYYRVEGTHTQTISGFGIGLYLCSEIVHRHSGKIWVESEVGKGSAFYFSLPLAD
ncbi:PAS domain S-box protein [uncultured Mucilaginibacter sp.]|uniref:PAS domain S-box protein n=1 Tax=uncultured Mucilaginibacter sp. TaxID=797541 RepID=UPI0026204630|nr:PAS domain S-box protein [uncultured Mucilaginibacter sp.]